MSDDPPDLLVHRGSILEAILSDVVVAQPNPQVLDIVLAHAETFIITISGLATAEKVAGRQIRAIKEQQTKEPI